MSVSRILDRAKNTFDERNKVYKDTYKHIGPVMEAMFPDGVNLATANDFERFAHVTSIAGKLVRYAQAFETGGHIDSAHDIINYAAFLENATHDLS